MQVKRPSAPVYLHSEPKKRHSENFSPPTGRAVLPARPESPHWERGASSPLPVCPSSLVLPRSEPAMGLQDHFLYIIGYGTALKCNKFVLLRRTTGRAGFQPARFARKSSTTVQSIQAMKRFVYTTLLLFLAAALAVQAQVSFSVAYKRPHSAWTASREPS